MWAIVAAGYLGSAHVQALRVAKLELSILAAPFDVWV
jgi:hypothetical protein